MGRTRRKEKTDKRFKKKHDGEQKKKRRRQRRQSTKNNGPAGDLEYENFDEFEEFDWELNE